MKPSTPASPAPRPTLIALVGATASGKTSLAVELCRRIDRPVEIVSLDSRQIYRHLDLGTGKPTKDELSASPHHLIDIIDPTDSYDAGRFRVAVEALLPSLWSRGVVPLLVGGAGFYLRALMHGLLELPGDRSQLEEVRAEVGTLSDEALREELERVDPASATRLHPHDRYRNERAVEVHRLSGRTMTELNAEFEPAPIHDARFSVFHLQLPRWRLHARIAERAESWLAGGWIEETERLLAEGWDEGCPGLSILGYREIVAVLRGRLAREELEERIVVATRRYGRQQETWFRKLTVEARGTDEDPRLPAALERALNEATPPGSP